MTWRGILVLLAAVLPGSPDLLEWDARRVFDRSVSDGVCLSADGSSIVLEDGELFEDDGPAAGFSYKPNEEVLTESTLIRKEFEIADPRARSATLLLGSADPMRVTVNGTTANLGTGLPTAKYWKAYRLDPGLLQPGTNRIVLQGPGKIWFARDDEYASGSRTRTRHPNRSAKSIDGGKTWIDDCLGTAGTADGEYYVRLRLDRHRSRGEVTLPVVDLGNLAGRSWGAPLDAVCTVRVTASSEADPACSITLRIRRGPTPDLREVSWQKIESAELLGNPGGRYLQVCATLSTSDPMKSPRLNGVKIEMAATKPPDWTAELRALDVRNEEVVRTSIPFEYEPFGHPKLKALREKHGLDDVVRGAKGEFDLIVRLAGWVSGQWQKMHLSESYPAWDALDILAPHSDGTSVGGFCQQYNVVLLQACESFGLVGRAVSIGQGDSAKRIPGSGHEVVEIWSNEFRKWVYIDGNAAWYAVDQEDGTPLSLSELRLRQLKALRDEPYRPIRVVEIAKTRHRWTGLKDWPPFLELRLIPRSNFLEASSPLPLNQGMRGWFWTGHEVWTDELSPASPIYSRRVHRRGNFDWSVNTVHLVLEPRVEAGEFRVHLDTETPGFDTFLCDIDGAGEKPVATGFVWKLHPGKNRIEARSRNSAGRTGPASWVTLEQP
jgi:hypothetical protein